MKVLPEEGRESRQSCLLRRTTMKCLFFSMVFVSPFAVSAIAVFSRINPRSQKGTTLHNQVRFLPFASFQEDSFSSESTVENDMKFTNSSKSASEYLEIAAHLQKRAKEILEEVKVLEAQQIAKKAIKTKEQEKITQQVLQRFFSISKSVSPQSICDILEQERWTVEQLIPITRTLFEQETSAISANNTQQGELSKSQLQMILDAVTILDRKVGVSKQGHKTSRWSGKGLQILTSQLREWRKADDDNVERRLAGDLYNTMKSNTTFMEGFLKKATDPAPIPSNQTSITVLPYWIPISLLPYIIAAKALLDKKDVERMKEKVLPASRFYCTSFESVPFAAVFRGNVRSNGVVADENPETHMASVFEEIQQLMTEEAISTRVQLFLLPDPEWVPGQNRRELEPNPVIIALPRTVVPNDSLIGQTKIQRFAQNIVTLMALWSICNFALRCYALNWNFYSSIVQKSNFASALSCYPIVIGILAVQIVHEMAHIFVAHRNGIKIGKPVAIPSPYLHAGLFGCITPLRSFPQNRSSLFDWALSGPMSGLLSSVLLMIFGLHHTVNASQAALMRFPVISIAELKCSFLTGTLISFLAPRVMMLPNSQPVPMHPLFMVGFTGLVTSALNMLPVFRLDGGRACAAVVGKRASAFASSWTLLMMLSAALSGSSIFGYWAAIVLLFQRRQDIPVRDDVTRVNDVRVIAWLISLAVCISALVPFPGGPFPLL